MAGEMRQCGECGVLFFGKRSFCSDPINHPDCMDRIEARRKRDDEKIIINESLKL